MVMNRKHFVELIFVLFFLPYIFSLIQLIKIDVELTKILINHRCDFINCD